MHVLIIGINYRPEPTGIGPYTAGLAEHLAARGEEVTVLTGLPSLRTTIDWYESRQGADS
jgi:colanic acid biosynthesis glycosyl transferase WcaI